MMKELQKSLDRYTNSALEWPDKENLASIETVILHLCNKEKAHKLQARLTNTLHEHQEAQLKLSAGHEAVARMESRANKGSALLWKASTHR
jgi:hypothetical protein